MRDLKNKQTNKQALFTFFTPLRLLQKCKKKGEKLHNCKKIIWEITQKHLPESEISSTSS